MATRTLIPALRARVGDWNYYICVMKYAQVKKEVSFAHELHGNSELSALIQRGLSDRTQGIVEYLLKSEHRFLGSLVVAAYQGDPSFIPVKMDETEEIVRGLDDQFGVLQFDGTQQYFALDGQHRLKAIKEALQLKPELGSEDISVILVSHYETEEGQQRTRRLFSNINRNAKATTHSENIALDEDDGFAILTRRLISEDPFLRAPGRVHTIKQTGAGEGGLSIATNVPKSSKLGITSIKQLYEMLTDLDFDLDPSMRNKQTRPSDKVLDDSYSLLSARLKSLWKACGDMEETVTPLSDIRSLRNSPENGHPMLRGVVQRSVTQTIGEVCGSKVLSWDQALARLSSLQWSLAAPPWTSVARKDGKNVRMLTSRDFKALLLDLLRVHIAPTSKADIARARKSYSDLFSEKYPISADDLAKNLIEQAT